MPPSKNAEAAPAPTLKPQHYIVCIRDTHLRLIGPFRRAYDASRWARSAKNNPSDDPRWQTIQLANPRHAVPLYAPTDPMPTR